MVIEFDVRLDKAVWKREKITNFILTLLLNLNWTYNEWKQKAFAIWDSNNTALWK